MLVPRERVARWFENFAARHGPAGSVVVDAGALMAVAEDGVRASARLPFGRVYDGAPDVEGFVAAVRPPQDWGLLLVRKGGFAVARSHGATLVESKVGRRHVQGRTQAGGQSQQRFARRRDNQARAAYEAAGEHAARILAGPPHVEALVCGGDRSAVEQVLADPRLAVAAGRRVDPWLPVPDPRRVVLEQGLLDAASVLVRLEAAFPGLPMRTPGLAAECEAPARADRPDT